MILVFVISVVTDPILIALIAGMAGNAGASIVPKLLPCTGVGPE